MKNYLKNNNGLTLVEILTALVLLSIVLVTFMSFFTQSAKFTANNYETLTAVQVAEDVIAKIRPPKSTAQTDSITHPDPYGLLPDLTGFEFLSPNIYITDTEYEPFSVIIEIEAGPEGLEDELKKAKVTVESAEGAGINNPKFITYMYFEDTP